MFKSNTLISERCKLVTPHCISMKYASNWIDYKQYYIKGNYNKVSGLSSTSPAAQQWPLDFPTCYFPLDSKAVGSTKGASPTAIDFTQSGIHGNAFSFLNPSGNLKAFYDLGTFQSPAYCFSTPDRCQHGMSISFWLNVLAENQLSCCQSFITSKPASTGPGLQVYWRNSNGMCFHVRRYTDSISEFILMAHDDFKNNYGFGKWWHYTMTYYFDGYALGNNMEVYVNGISRPESEKHYVSLGGINIEVNSGDLQISKNYINDVDGDDTNMELDEVIIWEVKLCVFGWYKYRSK